MKDKQYLYDMYNGTSIDDGTGEVESYENWLERQLLSRIEKIEELGKANEQHSERRQLTIPCVSVSVCQHYMHIHYAMYCDYDYCPSCGKHIKTN